MSDPDRLQGITEGDYQTWRHHPVTKLLLQYMADFRAVLEREAVVAWIDGSLQFDGPQGQEIRARILTLKEMGELPWGAIEEFYRKDTQPNAA